MPEKKPINKLKVICERYGVVAAALKTRRF